MHASRQANRHKQPAGPYIFTIVSKIADSSSIQYYDHFLTSSEPCYIAEKILVLCESNIINRRFVGLNVCTTEKYVL
jgi:hypothetical protein